MRYAKAHKSGRRNPKRRHRISDPITKAFRRTAREIMERKRQPRFGVEDEWVA